MTRTIQRHEKHRPTGTANDTGRLVLAGQPDEALRVLRKRLHDAMRSGVQRDGIMAMKLELGLVHHALHDDEGAMRWLLETLDDARAVGNVRTEAKTRFLIATIYDELADDEMALHHLTEADGIANGIDDPVLQGLILQFRLRLLARTIVDTDYEGLSARSAALTLDDNVPMRLKVGHWITSGIVHHSRDARDEARAAFDNAKALLDRSEHHGHAIHDWHLHIGLLAVDEGDYADAIDHLSTVRIDAEALQLRSTCMRIAQALATCFERLGRTDLAIAELHTANDLLREIRNSGRIRRIAEWCERRNPTERLRLIYPSLTNAELQVCEVLIVDDAPTKIVADTLNISARTVDGHRRSIRRKLDLEPSDDLRVHLIRTLQG